VIAVSYVQPLPGHASSHGRTTTSAIEASVLQAPVCGTVYRRTCDETWTLRVSSVNCKHFYSGVSQPLRKNLIRPINGACLYGDDCSLLAQTTLVFVVFHFDENKHVSPDKKMRNRKSTPRMRIKDCPFPYMVSVWLVLGRTWWDQQLLQKDRATLPVTEYFAKSLKVIRNDTVS